jgi:hypothetical protein
VFGVFLLSLLRCCVNDDDDALAEWNVLVDDEAD